MAGTNIIASVIEGLMGGQTERGIVFIFPVCPVKKISFTFYPADK